jgi:hypothetical protein
MSLRSYIRDFQDYQKGVIDINLLRRDNLALREAAVQMSKDIITLKEEDRSYRSNTYTDYGEAVAAISQKYEATARWGVFQTGNIIDLRAAFIISEGIKVSARERGKADPELEFCEKFLRYNDLDKEVAHEFAKEAEIEGKILVRLFWEEADKQVSARYVSWLAKKYEVEAHPLDYLDILKVKWTEEDKPVEIAATEFVYKKFGGRISKPNSAAPKIMKVLTKIEDLDKALRDLREIDRIFAAPLLVVKFLAASDAKKAQEDLDKMNWKIKKGLCTNGEVSFVQPSMSGIDSLETEIVTLAKMISGATGVPVHFLGLPDLLSNRATAENLMELINASTLKERTTWIGAYEELLGKAMLMSNAKTGLEQKTDALDPTKIKVNIPIVSAQQWAAIEKVFLPACVAGKISDELFLDQIPGINVEQELARKKATEKEEKAATEEEAKRIPPPQTELIQPVTAPAGLETGGVA